MMMAMPSIAWPVWFRVVLAIETMSWIADGDGQRTVLGEVQILAGHRRNDDAQRLRQHDLAQHLAACSPSARAASHCPCGNRLDAGADDLGDVGGGVEHEADQHCAVFGRTNRHAAADNLKPLQFRHVRALNGTPRTTGRPAAGRPISSARRDRPDCRDGSPVGLLPAGRRGGSRAWCTGRTPTTQAGERPAVSAGCQSECRAAACRGCTG